LKTGGKENGQASIQRSGARNRGSRGERMNGCARNWVACCSLALLVGSASMAARLTTQAEKVQENGSDGKKARFREFHEKVNEYDKLRNSLRDGIPPAAKKASAEQIQTHQEMLAVKIQGARKDAKPGDIFTAASQKAFRHEIEHVYSGKRAQNTHTTIDP